MPCGGGCNGARGTAGVPLSEAAAAAGGGYQVIFMRDGVEVVETYGSFIPAERRRKEVGGRVVDAVGTP